MKARVFLFSSFIAVIIALVFFCSNATFAQTVGQPPHGSRARPPCRLAPEQFAGR